MGEESESAEPVRRLHSQMPHRLNQALHSHPQHMGRARKRVLQSLVPSIRVITSAWACVSRSVGRSAVPFLPSRSDLRKPLFFRTVLPRSRDILLYSVFPGEGLSSVLPTVVSLCSLRHIPMYWNLQSIISVSFYHIPTCLVCYYLNE